MTTTKLIGASAEANDPNTSPLSALGESLRYRVLENALIAEKSGTPTEARVVVDVWENGSTQFRAVLYRVSDEALIAYSDWVDSSQPVNEELSVPVTSLHDVIESAEYTTGIETKNGWPVGLSVRIQSDSDTALAVTSNHDGGDYTFSDTQPPNPLPELGTTTSESAGRPIISFWAEDSPAPRASFTDGDPDTRLRDRDGNLVTAADVPIRVSTQRDPRGAPALTGAPVTMSITDGEATLDLSAADPMPETGDAIYVEVFNELATPEDDISRRYVLRMQDGAEPGE